MVKVCEWLTPFEVPVIVKAWPFPSTQELPARSNCPRPDKPDIPRAFQPKRFRKFSKDGPVSSEAIFSAASPAWARDPKL
jgi:hypothetical protein